MNKNNIFVDMDGTLAHYNNLEDIGGIEAFYREGYFASLKPFKSFINAVKELNANPDNEIFILSAVMPGAKFATKEKDEWIEKYLPEIKKENRIFMEVNQNKLDYIPKGIERKILIDDFNKNLEEWKQGGGLAIKFVNNLNDTNKSWKGNRIHYKDNKKITNDVMDIITNTYA